MNKKIKTISSVLIALLICFSACISSFAAATIPSATSKFYVNDFAGIFSEEEKSKLMESAVNLANDRNGVQVVVSTVESLDGDTIENYAVNMYNQYGIGKNDMGILILCSVQDRKLRVEVGKSMEAYINDSKAGRFMREYAIPLLKENKFNEGLINLQQALINEIIACVPEDVGNTTDTSSKDTAPIDATPLLLFLGGGLAIALVVYIVILIRKKIKERKNKINKLEAKIANMSLSECKLKGNHALEIADLNKTIEALSLKNSNLETSLKESESKLSTLNDRYERIIKLYPDADNKVDAMIEEELIQKDKEAASSIDKLISSVINLSPNKDIVNKLDTTLSSYYSLTSNQKEYVKSDLQKLRKLYDVSLKLKQDYDMELLIERRKKNASTISSEILSIISLVGIANASDLSRLKRAKKLYTDLDHETQKFVDNSIIHKLDDLISDAKRDKEREEEEERRRIQSSYSSFDNDYNSSSSFDSFSGFGGESGGGGASADF